MVSPRHGGGNGGGSVTLKIGDVAAFRDVYASDYARAADVATDGGCEMLLPLRWVPWEVYVLVSHL